ncbi:MAG TPA: hypothetical protein VHY35_14935 [Stellaceae bacterium]|jgi:tyrosinase|nr:hypothetical protein [Stellaceae bacterium]
MINSPATNPPAPGILPYHRRAGRGKSHALNLELGHLQRGTFNRADLVFEGVDHSGPSFEARVFLNHPDATADTPRTVDEGYAGSFHILGHGNCFGDVGHCDVDDRGKAPHDLRGPHPLTPTRKQVTITEALKQVLARDGKLEQVTLVPVAYGHPATSEADPEGFLKYEKMDLFTYD